MIFTTLLLVSNLFYSLLASESSSESQELQCPEIPSLQTINQPYCFTSEPVLCYTGEFADKEYDEKFMTIQISSEIRPYNLWHNNSASVRNKENTCMAIKSIKFCFSTNPYLKEKENSTFTVKNLSFERIITESSVLRMIERYHSPHYGRRCAVIPTQVCIAKDETEAIKTKNHHVTFQYSQDIHLPRNSSISYGDNITNHCFNKIRLYMCVSEHPEDVLKWELRTINDEKLDVLNFEEVGRKVHYLPHTYEFDGSFEYRFNSLDYGSCIRHKTNSFLSKSLTIDRPKRSLYYNDSSEREYSNEYNYESEEEAQCELYDKTNNPQFLFSHNPFNKSLNVEGGFWITTPLTFTQRHHKKYDLIKCININFYIHDLEICPTRACIVLGRPNSMIYLKQTMIKFKYVKPYKEVIKRIYVPEIYIEYYKIGLEFPKNIEE